MNKLKRVMILFLALLTIGVSGCSPKEPDPLIAQDYKTIAMVLDNDMAMRSMKDCAVRYFYLICNGDYENANKFIDRTDLSICTPDILRQMYSSTQNYDFTSSLRVVGTEIYEGYVRLKYIDLNDTDHSFEPSYEPEEIPSWYGKTRPVVPAILPASTYSLSDVNNDGVIDETDMLWEDNPELNPEYEDVTHYEDDIATETGVWKYSNIEPTYLAPSDDGLDFTEILGEPDKLTESKVEISNKVSSENKQEELSETSIPGLVRREVSKQETGVQQEQGELEFFANLDDNTSVDEMESLYYSEDVQGYREYVIDIDIAEVNGQYKVRLPSSMISTTRLMIKVPKDMRIKVGDLQLSTSMMNLDDFYVITKLPRVSTFDIELENKITGVSTKTIDVTQRVYYIFSSIMPPRELKDEIMSFSKVALQQMYNDLWAGVQFGQSKFISDYVSMSGNVRSIKVSYDYFYEQHRNSDLKTNYEIIGVDFPTDDNYDYYDVQYSSSDFRIENYNYITVPISLDVRMNEVYDGMVNISRTTLSGHIYLTREHNQWYIYDIDKEFLFSEY